MYLMLMFVGVEDQVPVGFIEGHRPEGDRDLLASHAHESAVGQNGKHRLSMRIHDDVIDLRQLFPLRGPYGHPDDLSQAEGLAPAMRHFFRGESGPGQEDKSQGRNQGIANFLHFPFPLPDGFVSGPIWTPRSPVVILLV